MGRVALVNEDALTPHNLTLEDAAANLNLDVNVSAGGPIAVEFRSEATGRSNFYCNEKLPFMKSHRKRGMEGVLNVAAIP